MYLFIDLFITFSLRLPELVSNSLNPFIFHHSYLNFFLKAHSDTVEGVAVVVVAEEEVGVKLMRVSSVF